MLFQEIKEELLRMFENSQYLDGYELDILKEEFNKFYKNEIYPFYKYSLDVEQQEQVEEQVEELKELVNKLVENIVLLYIMSDRTDQIIIF